MSANQMKTSFRDVLRKGLLGIPEPRYAVLIFWGIVLLVVANILFMDTGTDMTNRQEEHLATITDANSGISILSALSLTPGGQDIHQSIRQLMALNLKAGEVIADMQTEACRASLYKVIQASIAETASALTPDFGEPVFPLDLAGAADRLKAAKQDYLDCRQQAE